MTSVVVVDVVVVVFSLVENGVDDVVVKEVVVAFNVVMLTNQNVCNVVVVSMVSSALGASVASVWRLHVSVIRPCISSKIGWNSFSNAAFPQVEKT